MSDSELQQRRNSSRNCNQDVLLNIGFRREKNSSLFKNGTGSYILSPGIGQGKHEKYWFDIRDANLEKMFNFPKAWILLRIVPAWFAFFALDSIRPHLNEKTREWRAHSGWVYGFFCELDEQNHRIKITAKNDQSASFSADLLDRTKAKQALSNKTQIQPTKVRKNRGAGR